jgi:hypothetical protein
MGRVPLSTGRTLGVRREWCAVRYRNSVTCGFTHGLSAAVGYAFAHTRARTPTGGGGAGERRR